MSSEISQREKRKADTLSPSPFFLAWELFFYPSLLSSSSYVSTSLGAIKGCFHGDAKGCVRIGCDRCDAFGSLTVSSLTNQGLIHADMPLPLRLHFLSARLVGRQLLQAVTITEGSTVQAHHCWDWPYGSPYKQTHTHTHYQQTVSPEGIFLLTC